MAFSGIMNLRGDERVKMLPWQLEELRKCALDPIYFIKTYVYITTKDEGTQLFKMWDFQEDLVRKFDQHRFNIVKFPRQCGKSSTTRAYLLWYAIFSENKLIAMLGNKLALAKEQLQLLRESYLHLPYWLQPGVKSWSKLSVEFSHGTRIIVSATSPDNIRGLAINTIFLDEFAFVKPHIADDFIASVFPTVSSGKTTKVIITSTPCGMNQFYRMWQESVPEPEVGTTDDFIRSEITWDSVPGRDEEWARVEQKRIGEIRFNQEYKCEFIGSISTLIDHTFLKEMKAVTPLVISRLPSYIKVWQLPLPKERLERENWEYVASLDTGYGVHMDSTVLQLCLVKSNITIHQVAKMYSNSMDVELFCKRARELLKSYHDPSLIIEQNGPGAVATTWFHSTAEYEGLLHFDGGVRHMGLWATDKMKENAVILIKAYIQRGFLKISDIDTMDELKSFGRVGVNKWGAMGGNHDDHVTSLYWIPYYLNTQLFYGNIIDVNLQQLMDDEIILGVHKDEEDDKRLHTERNGPISNMSKIMEDATKYMDRNRFYNVPSPFDKYGNDNDSSVSVFKL